VCAPRVIPLLLLATSFGWPGCGDAGPPRAHVNGKVTYRGAAVQEGSITFRSPQSGHGAQAKIGPDGAYHVETAEGGLLQGTYRVFITPPLVVEHEARTPPVKVERDVKNIPKKYRREQTSGLEITVHEGENVYDVDMKD